MCPLRSSVSSCRSSWWSSISVAVFKSPPVRQKVRRDNQDGVSVTSSGWSSADKRPFFDDSSELKHIKSAPESKLMNRFKIRDSLFGKNIYFAILFYGKIVPLGTYPIPSGTTVEDSGDIYSMMHSRTSLEPALSESKLLTTVNKEIKNQHPNPRSSLL